MLTVSWFSAGVSSAVATRLAIEEVDRIIYTHIEDHHPDTLRFVNDCEEWFGKPVERLQSPFRDVDTAIKARGTHNGVIKPGKGYVNGPAGAPCTMTLKREVRKQWEADNINAGPFRYVWGLDATEASRAERIVKAMPDVDHLFPLIEDGITKEEAHKILNASGIKRPAMYDLGYHNNNCVGCVKGGMGYWNKIRVDFPEVFESRAKLERLMGGTCIKGVYLDELDPERGRHDGPIVEDCGLFCELKAIGAAREEE